MGPFEKPYWSKLQVELWVCTRSREAVGLAEHVPGRTRFADTSIGPDGLDCEAYDQVAPILDDESELIGIAITNYGSVCQFDDARKEVIVAISRGRLKEYRDRSSGVEFFDRHEVLRLWLEPRLEALRNRTDPLTLAEGIALLVRGRPASKEAWERLRRRYAGRFSDDIGERIKKAGQAIVDMIRSGTVEAFGLRWDADGGLSSPRADKECVYRDKAFLAHRLWIDPCTDSIWTGPDRGDGSFHPTNRAYRYVCLSRTQFLDTFRGHHTKAKTDCKPASSPNANVPNKSLDVAERPRVPAWRHVGGSKATIPPAPKRGPKPRYDWLLFHSVLDELIKGTQHLSQAAAVRAMSEWCAENWGDEGGPGEPANSMVRKHIANHPGAPWAKSYGKACRKPLSGRANTSARTS